MRQIRDTWRVLRGTHVTVELGHAVRINGELGMERFRLAHMPPHGMYAATLPEDIALPGEQSYARLERRSRGRPRRAVRTLFRPPAPQRRKRPELRHE